MYRFGYRKVSKVMKEMNYIYIFLIAYLLTAPRLCLSTYHHFIYSAMNHLTGTSGNVEQNTATALESLELERYDITFYYKPEPIYCCPKIDICSCH